MPISSFSSWDVVHIDLDRRASELSNQRKRHSTEERVNAFQLAATDVFVEKAQIHLTERGRNYYRSGVTCGVLAVLVAGTAIGTIILSDPAVLFQSLSALEPPLTDHFALYIVVYFIRTAVIGGLTAGLIYYFAALSRAFFHEATLLFARRHAIRFGRMYVYLKYGTPIGKNTLVELLKHRSMNAQSESIAAPSEATFAALIAATGLPENVRIDDLEKAFGWNLEVRTAFKDIKPDKMSTSLFAKMVDTVGELGRALGRSSSDREK